MKNTIIIFLLIFFNQIGVGQTSKIIISGSLADTARKAYTNDIWYYDEYNLFASNATDVYPFNLTNGDFKIEINSNSPYSYFRFRAVFIPSQMFDLYLIQPGDSIHMEIKQFDNVLFTGKGSEKLNYQNFASKILNDAQFFTKTDSIKYGNIGRTQMWIQKNYDGIKICLDSLDKLRELYDETTLEILSVNTLSAFNYSYVENVTGIYPFVGHSEKMDILSQLELLLLQYQMSPITNKTILKYTPAYRNLIYHTQLYFSRLLLNGKRIGAAKISHTYSEFRNRYRGNLRDILVTALLIHQNRDTDALLVAEDALTFMQNPNSVKTVRDFVSTRKPGQPAFNFSFETEKGQSVNLSDLKGKLIVIDTWYYGCTNCVNLAKTLSPVVHKYSKSKDVIFLSVNVDRKKDQFLKGIKSELYGEKGVFYVWTKGNGVFDPFIKHYQYFGYPNLLIIGKDGNVISTNPSQNGYYSAEKIEEIIKQNL